MPRNKGISTIQAIKCRTVEIPFFVISETNQPLCSVGVENTDLLSVGREYRLAVLARRGEDTVLLSVASRVAAERCHSGNSQSFHLQSTESFLQ